jgi:TIR domain
MQFSKHLLISYTHIDNQKLEGQEYGWVSRLHNALAVQLEMRLGEKVDIWWDKKLAGNDIFAEEIIAQLSSVGLLVSVLSPRYMKSEWCKREANEFCRAAASAGGVRVDRKSRVFKVYKLPVDTMEGLPNEFGDALGFPFYKDKDDVPIEIDPAYGGQMTGDFNLGVAILAQKIVDMVRLLRQANGPAKRLEAPSAIVYLGETGWDRDPERKMLEAEISGRGYKVVPEYSLSAREKDCEAEVSKLLDESQLSIHMIGSQPGMTPSGPTQISVDALQNLLASRQSQARKLRRIVWIPPDTRSKNPEHQSFIDALARDEVAQFGADVVTGDFEALKSAVLDTLDKLQSSKPAALDKRASQGGQLVYLICDRRDVTLSVELRKSLRRRGFDPQRPLFEGDAGTVREQNEWLLEHCHAVIVYYGAGDEAWYRSTLIQLDKATRRIPVWTYVAGTLTAHKQELIDEFDEGRLINGLVPEGHKDCVPEGELDRMQRTLQPAGDAGGPAQ